jgi:outer membrane protein assembly factor BamB
MSTRLLGLAIVCATLAPLHAADDWPRFRGWQAGVADDDPRLPETWSPSSNIAWKLDLPGLSWSSPVVQGNHIIVSSAISAGAEAPPEKGLFDPGDEQHGKTRSTSEHRWVVYDVDFETGQIHWSREVARLVPKIGRHVKNSFASETAVIDGDAIYVYFGAAGVVASLDLKGQIRWTRTVPAHESYFDMGTAASPVVYKGRVYIVHDNLTDSFMAAFDARTGEPVWNIKRDENKTGATWSTPYIWENQLRTELVTSASGKVRSYDLDGKLLWELSGMTFLTAPSPFAKNELLYFSSGYPGASPRPVYAVRPGASGDISLKPGETSNAHVVWYQPTLGTYQTSALVYGGYYYTLLDRGFLLCHDAKTGRQIYGRQRISPEGLGFTASPWAYNGKIFLLSEDGDTFVIQAGPEFKVLGKNSLDEMALASPAIAHGSVILRTQSKLYRISQRAANTAGGR